MTVLASPKEEYWKDLNSMIGQFTANSKTEKIKKKFLIGDYNDGCFSIPDIPDISTQYPPKPHG